MLSFSRYLNSKDPNQIRSRVLDLSGANCRYCTSLTNGSNNIMCMDGGKLHINQTEPEVYKLFLDAYAEDVFNGLAYYMVEKNATVRVADSGQPLGFSDEDPVVNLFLELDIQQMPITIPVSNAFMGGEHSFVTREEWAAQPATPLDVLRSSAEARLEFVRAVVGIMFGVLARSYCDQGTPLSDEVRAALWCVVADNEGPAKGDAWQAGFHLHFPEIRMRLSNITRLIHAMVHALQHHLPEGTRENLWTDRLDKTPYACGKGLRLIGSYKAKPCNTCGKTKSTKGENVCGNCMNTRFTPQFRRYMPWVILECNFDAGDPRDLFRTRAQAQSRARVREMCASEIRTNLGALKRLVRLCSTKVGIVDGKTDESPPGFVGDSTYVFLPSRVVLQRQVRPGKVVKVQKATSDAEYAIVEPPSKPPSNSMRVEVQPTSEVTAGLEALVAMLPVLFQCDAWATLAISPPRFFARRTPPGGSRAAGTSDLTNIYVLLSLKKDRGGAHRYCCNKAGYHSTSSVYFEVRPVQDVFERLLSSNMFSSTRDIGSRRPVAYVVQRCWSGKTPFGVSGSKSCRFFDRAVEYPLALEARIFPPAIKAAAPAYMDRAQGMAIKRLIAKAGAAGEGSSPTLSSDSQPLSLTSGVPDMALDAEPPRPKKVHRRLTRPNASDGGSCSQIMSQSSIFAGNQ